MKHYGDITKINGADVPIVDIVTGGSPCQDLSIAGRREGLDGERSGLFMEQIRVIKEMRNECKRRNEQNGRPNDPIRPRFMVWENVTGAFSTGTPPGEDFRIVLEETARVVDPDTVIPRPPNLEWSNVGVILGDRFSIAWRVHDAQFWGVPQRRRRISLVADFGGHAAPRYCLSEKACRGILNRAEKRGKVLPPLLEAALKARCHSVNVSGTNGGGGKGILIQNESVGTISTLSNLHKVVYDASRRHNYEEFGEVAGTVQAHFGTGGGNVPIVCEDNIESYDARGKGNGKVAPSLTGDHERRVSDYTALIVENKMQGFDAYNQTVTGDVSMTLSGAAQDPHHIATVFGISPYDSNAMKSPNPESGIYEAETARTLDLNGGSPACNQGGMMIVESYRQDKFDKYEPTDKSATIKSAGGTFGGE